MLRRRHGRRRLFLATQIEAASLQLGSVTQAETSGTVNPRRISCLWGRSASLGEFTPTGGNWRWSAPPLGVELCPCVIRDRRFHVFVLVAVNQACNQSGEVPFERYLRPSTAVRSSFGTARPLVFVPAGTKLARLVIVTTFAAVRVHVDPT